MPVYLPQTPPWETYTPTLTNVTSGTTTGSFRADGTFRASITAGTATAAGTITISLPSGWTAAAGSFATPVVALHNNGGGTFIDVSSRVVASGSTVTVYADGAGASFTLGQSVICTVSGVLELA